MEQPVNPITGIPMLADSYVIGNGYDFVDIVCEEHAREFAAENGLQWHNAGYGFRHPAFTDDAANGCYAYERASYDLGETDSPDSCSVCHVYVECQLTRDGEEYVKQNGFPQWLIEALIP